MITRAQHGIFKPIRFSGFPELKETFLANDLEKGLVVPADCPR
jgi:hypothetical protein